MRQGRAEKMTAGSCVGSDISTMDRMVWSTILAQEFSNSATKEISATKEKQQSFLMPLGLRLVNLGDVKILI